MHARFCSVCLLSCSVSAKLTSALKTDQTPLDITVNQWQTSCLELQSPVRKRLVQSEPNENVCIPSLQKQQCHCVGWPLPPCWLWLTDDSGHQWRSNRWPASSFSGGKTQLGSQETGWSSFLFNRLRNHQDTESFRVSSVLWKLWETAQGWSEIWSIGREATVLRRAEPLRANALKGTGCANTKLLLDLLYI